MDASLNTQVGNVDFGTSSGGKVYVHKIVFNVTSTNTKKMFVIVLKGYIWNNYNAPMIVYYRGRVV